MLVIDPCPVNKDITVYECETGEIPNLDAIPEVGSFAVRHLAKIKKSDFKLSPKNQAGVFVGFATLKGTYGSVLMVGEGKYVVAREHVAYVQDHFPLQRQKSANPELEWLHRLLGRYNDNELVQVPDETGPNRGPQGDVGVMSISEEEVALDPSLLASDTADAENGSDQSDGLESDDEVSAVMEQLDETVPLLAEYSPAIGGSVVSRNLASNDGESGAVNDASKANQDGRGDDLSDMLGTNDVEDPHPPRRSNRLASASTRRDAINHADFRARSTDTSSIDKAKSIDTITEKELRANKTIIVGRKIKRFFPQLGGSWGLID